MPKVLTREQIDHYCTRGFIHPLRCMSAAEAARLLGKLDAFESETGLSATKDLHFKFHLYFSWLMELSQSPSLLDPVEDLIGPDILAFTSNFWIKRAGDGAFVTWHQDSAYFGLEPHELCAAWIALTPSTRANGCMRVMPGSHLGPSHTHVETYHGKNLLARGQRIDGLDETKAVDLELQPGEFSLHNERTYTARSPTPRTRTGSGSRSSSSRPACARPSGGAPRGWCAAPTATAIGTPIRCRRATATRASSST
jgi:hypothetical protein